MINDEILKRINLSLQSGWVEVKFDSAGHPCQSKKVFSDNELRSKQVSLLFRSSGVKREVEKAVLCVVFDSQWGDC